MTNHIFDPAFLKFNEQPAEPSTEDTTNSKMDTLHTQDSVSNPPRMEEPSKISSPPQLHANDQATQTDLNIYETLVHTIASSLHNIFTQQTKVTQLRTPSDTLHNKLSHQLQTLSKQVERLQQAILRDKNLRKLPMNKLENRICFRCEKSGHIAKNCRSRPSQKQQSRQIRQHKPLRNQHFKKKLNYHNSRNIGYNPLIYHTRDN